MGAATATLLVTVIASMLSFPYLMKQLSSKPQIKKDKPGTVVK
jgi:Na+-driven multidrug efflux pump